MRLDKKVVGVRFQRHKKYGLLLLLLNSGGFCGVAKKQGIAVGPWRSSAAGSFWLHMLLGLPG